MKTRLKHFTLISATALALSACGGSSSSGGGNPVVGTVTIKGTVPGTTIEAFGDNGSYYKTTSTQNGTNQHPFSLDLPANMGVRLVMTTNEGTPDQVSSPIAFKDSSGQLQTRLMASAADGTVDLGNVAIPVSRADAVSQGLDSNADGVLDQPFELGTDNQSKNPLQQTDADQDGIKDFADQDHGAYQYDKTKGEVDPQDPDGDGLINVLDNDDDGDGIVDSKDPDYTVKPATLGSATQGAITRKDSDGDGIYDHLDANPDNAFAKTSRVDSNGDGVFDKLNTSAQTTDGNRIFTDDLNRDGYHDNDANRDGFFDDDTNRDGFHAADKNFDGFHDDDLNHDGFRAGDLNKDGWRDNDANHDGFGDGDLNHDGFENDDANHDGFGDADLNHNGLESDDVQGGGSLRNGEG